MSHVQFQAVISTKANLLSIRPKESIVIGVRIKTKTYVWDYIIYKVLFRLPSVKVCRIMARYDDKLINSEVSICVAASY